MHRSEVVGFSIIALSVAVGTVTLGGLAFVARSIPTTVFGMAKRSMTTTLTVILAPRMLEAAE